MKRTNEFFVFVFPGLVPLPFIFHVGWIPIVALLSCRFLSSSSPCPVLTTGEFPFGVGFVGFVVWQYLPTAFYLSVLATRLPTIYRAT